MTKLGKEMCSIARLVGGSYKTVHDRMSIVGRFTGYLAVLNIQVKQVQHIKAKHIENFIHFRQQQGISARTLQNEMAALRGVLRLAGRTKLVESERLTNQALKISGASRMGTKSPITAQHFQDSVEKIRLNDEGMAIALQLSRLMGLRSQEAVQSVQSLKTWQKALEQGHKRLTVVFGTKGGRPRETIILNREMVSQTVNRALQIAEQCNGRLINKPDLKTAMCYWHNTATRSGLTGEYSPHSLRYAWAQEALDYYQSEGFSHKEACALTSMDLGHGDGRGRYVEYVYGLEV